MGELKFYRINEIFASLQGEGYWTGRAAVFVRFSGCNLRCPFCDTDFRQYESLTREDILRRVQEASSSCRFVILTGGEPTLQVDSELVDLFHQHHYYIAMETNGTLPCPEGVDWVTCSPKGAYCAGAKLAVRKVHEVKVVYDGEHPVSDEGLECQARYLQPCDTGDETRNKEILLGTIRYVMEHPQWRLSLQTHKFLGIR